jgi:hypothetical protein
VRQTYRTFDGMNLRQHLITLIDAFAKARGISGSRVTTLAMNSGNMYRTLVEGGNMDATIQWFSDNWPEGVAWPEGLARPAPTASTTEAA